MVLMFQGRAWQGQGIERDGGVLGACCVLYIAKWRWISLITAPGSPVSFLISPILSSSKIEIRT